MEVTKKELLQAVSCDANGDWENEFKIIKEKRKYTREQLNYYNNLCKAETLCIGDEKYPEAFMNINNPPFILYYYGNIDLLSNKFAKLSIVGSREPSEYAIKSTYALLSELVKSAVNICIVSGMAKGIDATAHRVAMENNRPTIAILGCGIDSVYPKENNDIYEYCKQGKGLILSEYPNTLAPFPNNFSKRNRLITALSHALFVPHAKEKSGTSISIKFATEQCKDILCLPARIYEDQMTNNLIKDGCYLVNKYEDFLPFLRICERDLPQN